MAAGGVSRHYCACAWTGDPAVSLPARLGSYASTTLVVLSIVNTMYQTSGGQRQSVAALLVEVFVTLLLLVELLCRVRLRVGSAGLKCQHDYDATHRYVPSWWCAVDLLSTAPLALEVTGRIAAAPVLVTAALSCRVSECPRCHPLLCLLLGKLLHSLSR